MPQVWVERDGDAARARGVIDEFLRANPNAPPRKCRECGEDNPATFETCWACGHPLD